MTNIPECPWRPARWLTTEFVRPFTVAVLEEATALRKLVTTDDEYIKVVANYVRDNFTYPLEKNGDPSAGLCFRRYDKGWLIKRYFYNQEMDYAWGFPQETIKMGKGICIDTALLCTSLLISGGVPSKVALGAVVNAKDGTVAGYHAWSTFIYKSEPCANETTIHSPDVETLTKLSSVYDKNSDWAKNTGIYYRQEAEFDNKTYDATGQLGKDMVCLMGLTSQRVECYGLTDTLERADRKRRSMAREWRKSEVLKQHILSQAYGKG
jgi:hypothetical protein